jgi:hypothetical protein
MLKLARGLVAADVPKKVLKSLEGAIKRLREEAQAVLGGKYADLHDMYLSDADDMEAILGLLKDGNSKRALDQASRMDTAAREEIPMLVWDFLTDMAEMRKKYGFVGPVDGSYERAEMIAVSKAMASRRTWYVVRIGKRWEVMNDSEYLTFNSNARDVFRVDTRGRVMKASRGMEAGDFQVVKAVLDDFHFYPETSGSKYHTFSDKVYGYAMSHEAIVSVVLDFPKDPKKDRANLYVVVREKTGDDRFDSLEKALERKMGWKAPPLMKGDGAGAIADYAEKLGESAWKAKKKVGTAARKLVPAEIAAVVTGVRELKKPERKDRGWSTNPNWRKVKTYLVSGIRLDDSSEDLVVGYLERHNKDLVPTNGTKWGKYGLWTDNKLQFHKGNWFVIAESGYSGG